MTPKTLLARHTPGVWRANENNPTVILGDDQLIAGECCQQEIAVVSSRGLCRAEAMEAELYAEATANCARIIACVNACSAMADPTAEIPALVAEVIAARKALGTRLKNETEE